MLRDAFLHSMEDQESSGGGVNESEVAQVVHFAKFLGFLAANVDDSPTNTSVLLAALKEFTAQFLVSSDIHSLTGPYSPETRKDILPGYFAALATLASWKQDVYWCRRYGITAYRALDWTLQA